MPFSLDVLPSTHTRKSHTHTQITHTHTHTHTHTSSASRGSDVEVDLGEDVVDLIMVLLSYTSLQFHIFHVLCTGIIFHVLFMYYLSCIHAFILSAQ